MIASHHRTDHSHMIVTGRQGPGSPPSAGLNLKKWVKFALNLPQKPPITGHVVWGTFGVGNVMFPAFLSGSRLPENSAGWVAGQSNQQLAREIIVTVIDLDERGMCSGG